MGNRRRRGKKQIRANGELCIYCGLRPAVKSDHVVGVAFFPDHIPNNIIVPSCNECDSGTGDGGDIRLNVAENDFRDALLIRYDIGSTNLAVQDLRDRKVRQSLKRNSKRILPSLLNESVRFVKWKANTFGVVRPLALQTFSIDVSKVERIVRKVVRGLHYFRWRKPLPADWVIRVLGDLDMQSFRRIQADFIDEWHALSDHPQSLDIFAFKELRFNDKEYICWLLVYYRKFACWAIAIPPDDPLASE